jgi:hypothetical protein
LEDRELLSGEVVVVEGGHEGRGGVRSGPVPAVAVPAAGGALRGGERVDEAVGGTAAVSSSAKLLSGDVRGKKAVRVFAGEGTTAVETLVVLLNLLLLLLLLLELLSLKLKSDRML